MEIVPAFIIIIILPLNLHLIEIIVKGLEMKKNGNIASN